MSASILIFSQILPTQIREGRVYQSKHRLTKVLVLPTSPYTWFSWEHCHYTYQCWKTQVDKLGKNFMTWSSSKEEQALPVYVVSMPNSNVTVCDDSEKCGAWEINLGDQLGPVVSLDQSPWPQLPWIYQPRSPWILEWKVKILEVNPWFQPSTGGYTSIRIGTQWMHNRCTLRYTHEKDQI